MRVLVALIVFLSVFVGACSPRVQPAVPAPVNRPPIEQIPVDLDVVIRLDLRRFRATVDPIVADAIGRLLVSQAREPLDLVVAALARTDKLWLGLRPDADPRRWDNVLVLEGDFGDITTKQLSEVFGPPRDLGGGFRAYDAHDVPSRTAPARLYTYLEERWIIASEAEVDALERVIERHRAERTLEPPERGILSMAARLGRVSESFEERSPKAAKLAAKAVSMTATVDASADSWDAEARIEFESEEDASLAGAGLRVLLFVVKVPEATIGVEVAEKTLIVDAEVNPRLVHRWAPPAE